MDVAAALHPLVAQCLSIRPQPRIALLHGLRLALEDLPRSQPSVGHSTQNL